MPKIRKLLKIRKSSMLRGVPGLDMYNIFHILQCVEFTAVNACSIYYSIYILL